MFDAFFNPRGFRPWLLAEERELALERQAEEHHRSESEQNHSESLFGRARDSCATASSTVIPRLRRASQLRRTTEEDQF